MNNPLYIAFIWHMHQPYYKDPQSGEYVLPWVRLHATKDYLDMLKILEKFPRIHQTFNLVPSLLQQLNDYASERLPEENFLKLTLKKAAQLSLADKEFILENFFSAQPDFMIKSFPRYYDLFARKRSRLKYKKQKLVEKFTTQDYLDLQVFFNLTWIDPYFRQKDAQLKKLTEKGMDYSEEDKKIVLQKQLEIIRAIIPEYKRMQESGQIEISTTPYYHPILPLVYDLNSAQEALPEITLPQEPFAYPEDALWQLEQASQYFEKLFQKKPHGLWPSEEAVSDEVLGLVQKAGFSWLVTDEEILFRSLPATVKVSREALFQPYYVEKNGKRLNIIFRDRNLSDLIGFAYQKWQSKDAVGDFLAKLKEVKQAFADKKEGPTLLTIALDGENCWEYYPNDGRDFLSSLYEKLSEERNFSCVTVSEFLEQFPAQEKLEHIFAGSWIYANFTTWIGQSEKNLAWDYLSKARKKLAESAAARPQFVKDATWKKAWEKIYIAEGSDWFWWYGRNLPDSAIGKFDELFRKNLSQVYQLLAEPVPDYLKLPIRTEPKETVIVPTSLIKPTINGIEDNYLEWLGAGELDLCGSADCVIQRFFWGFAQENLYLRFDLNFDYREKDFKKDIILNIFFSQPELKIRIALDKLSAFIFLKTETDSWQRKKQIFTIAWKKILELEIARDEFFTDKGKTEIWAVLEKEGQVLEACPKTGRISLNFPDKDFEASSWSV